MTSCTVDADFPSLLVTLSVTEVAAQRGSVQTLGRWVGGVIAEFAGGGLGCVDLAAVSPQSPLERRQRGPPGR